METISLKALADKVLQRNRQGNPVETSGFHGRKLEAEKRHLRKLAQIKEGLRYEGPITHKAFSWAMQEMGYSAYEAERLIAEGMGEYWKTEPGVTGKEIYRPMEGRENAESI